MLWVTFDTTVVGPLAGTGIRFLDRLEALRPGRGGVQAYERTRRREGNEMGMARRSER